MRTIIENDDQWHELRAKHIGGSEIAALFGLSPYLTAYTLWHEKAGKVKRNYGGDDDRQRWGKMMEPLLAQEIGRKLGWHLERSRTYHEHPTVPGMGCTLDFDVLDHQWGPGLVETKVIFEYADYKRDWSDKRGPAHFELQVQHQIACTGFDWAALTPFVAQTATMPPALVRRANAKVIAEIQDRTAAFWQSIADDKPPPPTGTEAEYEILKEIWPEETPRQVVSLSDMALAEAAQTYLWATDQLPGLEREKTARKVQLLNAALGAELLRVPGYDVDIRVNVKKAISIKVRANAENGVEPPPADPSTLASG